MGRSGTRRRLSCIGVALTVLGIPAGAHAQYIGNYFPTGVPGFDRDQGVTVLSRLRPLYDEPGVRLGAYTVNARLDESVGYDSNITGISRGRSSGFVKTSPSVSANSNWSRNRLGISASLDDYSYFSASGLNYTNYSAAIGGGYTIGRHDLNVAYSHFRQHELGTDIGFVASATPLPYDVDAIRTDYTVEAGRFAFSPNIDFRLYQFGNALVVGQPANQAFRDRTVLTGGVTTRYELSDQRGILVVLQGINSHYIRPQSTQISNNSKSVLLLAGIDYQATGLWRYRLLGGVEVRSFASSQYGTRAAPVAEANVIYTPTGLTTLTGIVRREIEDPQTEGVAGYTFTTAGLIVDHEYRRNILLQGRGTFQAAEFLQGAGSTTSYSVGAGVNWLVNRRVRLSADYDFTQQNGSNNGTFIGTQISTTPIGSQVNTLNAPAGQQLNTLTTGTYNRNVVLLGLHLAL